LPHAPQGGFFAAGRCVEYAIKKRGVRASALFWERNRILFHICSLIVSAIGKKT
jgi:hypothetical protein